MRIHLSTSANNELVPFNYQQKLIGVLHRWLGTNELHDKISLYSFSWLKGGKKDIKTDSIFLMAPTGLSLFVKRNMSRP